MTSQPVLPEGYRQIEREGIVIYLRNGDEAFLESVFPTIQKRRDTLRPLLAEMEKNGIRLSATLTRSDPIGLKTDNGRKLFESLVQQLDADNALQERMKRVWSKVERMMERLYCLPELVRVSTEIMSLQRIRIVSTDEIQNREVPFFRFNPETGNVSTKVQIGVRGSGESFVTDDNGKKIELSEFTLSTPVFKGTSPANRTWIEDSVGWREQLQNTLDQYDSPEKDGITGIPPEAMGPGVARYFVLHETAEVALVERYRFRDALARWFHDGMANYLAHQVIRKVISEDAYEKTAYSPKYEIEYEAQKKNVNLLAWPRVDLERFLKWEPSHAHYYWATHEIRGLANRHGQKVIPKLLEALKKASAITTNTICATIYDLTNESFYTRLASYCPQVPETDTRRKILALVARGELQSALPLARSLVLAEPRNSEYRVTLTEILLSINGVEYADELLFHYHVGMYLRSADGEPPVAPKRYNRSANTLYGMGRLMESIGKPLVARHSYEEALKAKPDHAASLKRLRMLDESPEGDK